MFHSLSMLENLKHMNKRTNFGGFDMVLKSMVASLELDDVKTGLCRSAIVTFVLQNLEHGLTALDCLTREHPHPKSLDKTAFKELCSGGADVVGIAKVLRTARAERSRKEIKDDYPVWEFPTNPTIRECGIGNRDLSLYLPAALMGAVWQPWTQNPKSHYKSNDDIHAANIANCYVATTFSIPVYLKSATVWETRAELACMLQDKAHIAPDNWPNSLDGATEPKNMYRDDNEATQLVLEQNANIETEAVSKKVERIIKDVKFISGVKDVEGNILVSDDIRKVTKKLIQVRVQILL